MSLVQNDHVALTNAGWSYRTNERGWVIYRHPDTGHWHSREDAIGIVAADEVSGGRQIPVTTSALTENRFEIVPNPNFPGKREAGGENAS